MDQTNNKDLEDVLDEQLKPTCYVCQENQELVQTCGDEKHKICDSCKQKWNQTSRKCPICRKLMIGFDSEIPETQEEQNLFVNFYFVMNSSAENMENIQNTFNNFWSFYTNGLTENFTTQQNMDNIENFLENNTFQNIFQNNDQQQGVIFDQIINSFQQNVDLAYFFHDEIFPLLIENLQITTQDANYFFSGWLDVVAKLKQESNYQQGQVLDQKYKFSELEAEIEIEKQVQNQTMSSQQIYDIFIERLTKPVEDYIQEGKISIIQFNIQSFEL